MGLWARLSVLLAFFLSVAACGDGASVEKQPVTVDLLITNVNLVDVATGEVKPQQDIAISGDKISHIVANGSGRFEADRQLEGTGKYIIPGLWDMHAHVRSLTHNDTLPMFVAHGITGLRDLGLTDHVLIKKWQKDISTRAIVGPRIISSGVIIEGAEPRFPSSVSISTLEEVKPKLDALIADGAKIAKVFQNIPGDVFAAIVAYAHENGLVTSGHIPTGWRQHQASEAGLGSIEHMFGVADTFENYGDNQFTENEINALAQTLIENNTYQSPTMVNLEYFVKLGDSVENSDQASVFSHDNPDLAYVPHYFRNWWAGISARNKERFKPEDYQRFRERLETNGKILKALHARGVKLLAGTDVPNPYIIAGVSLHDELGLFVKAGLSNLDALKTATLYPAQYFGMEETLGQVTEGAYADLVMLDANPLENIENTRRINAVITGGRAFDSGDIDALRAQQIADFKGYALTDFDQYIYMDVRRNGVMAVREKYPDLADTESYQVRPHHLRRLAEKLIEGLRPDEAKVALEWNILLFPDDVASQAMLTTLNTN